MRNAKLRGYESVFVSHFVSYSVLTTTCEQGLFKEIDNPQAIAQIIQTEDQKSMQTEALSEGVNKWQEVAKVWDRFFFVIGLLAVVVINVVIFIIYPWRYPQNPQLHVEF